MSRETGPTSNLDEPRAIQPIEHQGLAKMRRFNDRDLDPTVAIEIRGTYRIEPTIGLTDRIGDGDQAQRAPAQAIHRDRRPLVPARTDQQDLVLAIALKIDETRFQILEHVRFRQMMDQDGAVGEPCLDRARLDPITENAVIVSLGSRREPSRPDYTSPPRNPTMRNDIARPRG